MSLQIVLITLISLFIIVISIAWNNAQCTREASPVEDSENAIPNEIEIQPTDKINYRLGDIILMNFKRHEACDEGWSGGKLDGAESLRDCTIRMWPESIASLYMKQTNDESNMKVLNKIVSEKSKTYTSLPDKDTAVFHIRVGDVIDINLDPVKYPKSRTFTAEEFWSKRTCSFPHIGCPDWAFYVRCKSEMQDKINRIKTLKIKIKKICFVYGVHAAGDFPESKKYLAKCKELCENQGFVVELKNHKDADESFVYMCNSKVFVQGRGGFSRLIANVVRYRSNMVI